MKGKAKRLLAILLTIAMCMSNIVIVSASGTTAEISSRGTNSEYTGEKEAVKEEDYEDVSFEHTFKIQNEWEKHYNAEMTLKNTNDSKMENWEVAFMYDGEIKNIWNAKIVSHYDNVYVIKNAGWNQDINAGEQVTFGFTVQYEGEKPEEPCNLDMQRISEQVVAGCDIKFKQFTKYENKIQGQIEITNTSDSYIEDWSFEFESNFEIVDIWNAKVYEQDYESGEGNPTQIYYNLDNMGYNQSIEPGQTINFGFIGVLLEDDDGKVENKSLHQLTVYPYENEDELDEDDCIWEGDEEDGDSMSVVDDEIFDEDDYDRMEEDELAAEVDKKGSVRLFSNSGSARAATLSSETGKKSGDKISYYVYGLPHKRQVQTWYLIQVYGGDF